MNLKLNIFSTTGNHETQIYDLCMLCAPNKSKPNGK